MAFAHNGDVQLAFEQTSPPNPVPNFPALIFIPGWGEAGRTWGREIAHFSSHYSTLTYDRRGLGNSGKPYYAEAYTSPNEQADLAAVLEAAGLADRKLVIVAHSQGWFIALQYALAHPEQVAGIVSLTAPVRQRIDDSYPHGVMTRAQLDDMEQAFRTNPAPWLSSYADMVLGAARAEADRLHAAITNLVPGQMSPDIAIWTFECYYNDDLRPLLPKLQTPVLVVAGEDDISISLQSQHEIAAALPHAQLVIVPQAGHLLHLTHAPALNAAIEQFLGLID